MPEHNGTSAQDIAQLSKVLSDEEIVSRVSAGDLAPFEILVRRYNQRLFRVVRSIVGSDDEAEDVLQETYVRAFECLAQFAGRAKFSTWLTKIALHESFARLRRRRRIQAVDFSDPENVSMLPQSTGFSAERQASSKELGTLLTRVVDDLPEELRVVFVMRMIEGLDTSEAARCLELTEANVKVRLHRARSLLRNNIDEHLGCEVRRLYQFGGERCGLMALAVMRRIRQARARSGGAQTIGRNVVSQGGTTDEHCD